MKNYLFLGSISAFLAVALGAFGAHGLKEIISEGMMRVYQTGNEYHFYHSLGLLVIGIIQMRRPDQSGLKWSGWLMLSGIVIFSGSLYLLSVTGIRWLGAITPVGGLCLMGSWLFLAVACRDLHSIKSTNQD